MDESTASGRSPPPDGRATGKSGLPPGLARLRRKCLKTRMIDTISDLRAALREAFYRDAGGEHPLDDITPVINGLCELVSRWEEGDIEMDQLYPTFIRYQPRGFSITDWFIEMHNACVYDRDDLHGLSIIELYETGGTDAYDDAANSDGSDEGSDDEHCEDGDEDNDDEEYERELQESERLKQTAERLIDDPTKFRRGQQAISRCRSPSLPKHPCLALYQTPYFTWHAWRWEDKDADIWSARSPIAEYDIWERLSGFILLVHESRLQIQNSAHPTLAEAQKAAADHLAKSVEDMQRRLSDVATALDEESYELGLGSGLIKLDPQPDGRQFDHRQEIA